MNARNGLRGLLSVYVLSAGAWIGFSVVACTLLHATRVPEVVRSETLARERVWGGFEERWPLPDEQLRVALQHDSESWAEIERQVGSGAPTDFLDVVRSQKLLTAESARRIETFTPEEKLALVRSLRDVWRCLEGYYQ